MEIMPRVHLIPDVIANPYLIVEDDGLTLIDAGLRGSDHKILEYISSRGLAPSDLRRILITHADGDHVGGLAAIKRRTGARVFASGPEAAAISAGRPSRPLRTRRWGLQLLLGIARGLFKPLAVAVDEVLSDGQILPVLGGLQVIDTRGHTPGHLSYFSPSTGILFAGDSIVSRDGRLIGSIPANTWDAETAAASVRKQAALAPRVVCSGHGPVVMDATDRMPLA